MSDGELFALTTCVVTAGFFIFLIALRYMDHLETLERIKNKTERRNTEYEL